MDKVKLIEKIKVAQAATPASDEYTDRNSDIIAADDRANFRVGGKWFPGTITKFKSIEDDQYAYALLDGSEKVKMFHTMDVELDKNAKSKSNMKKKEVPQEQVEEVKKESKKAVLAELLEQPSVEEQEVEQVEEQEVAPIEVKTSTRTSLPPASMKIAKADAPVIKTKEADKNIAKDKKAPAASSDDMLACIFAKGDDVTFTSAKNSKLASNQELKGKVVSVKTDKGKYWLSIKVEGLGHFMKEASKCQK